MRSPNKDFLMDVEQSTSSKDALWDYGGNSFVTNEPNITSSSFPVNERFLHGTGANPDMPANRAEECAAVNDAAKTLTKSPCKKQTARKSIGRVNLNNSENLEEQTAEIKLEPNADDDVANIAAKVLHFFCQKCKNGIRYSPNDLQKHFMLSHNGELPLYPCEMCNFSAQDFQEFKQHRKTHRDALVKCDICNNDNLYTLLGLTKHFLVAHCVNGHFSCSKCRFSTKDVGTFVQHIHKHSGIEYACQKCNHISFSKAEFQRHLQGHSTALPFSCQYCNYSAMRKDFIVKHVLARHREHVHTREDLFQDNANEPMAQTNAGLKLALKRNPTDTPDKSLWRQEDNGLGIEKSAEKPSGFHFKSPDKEVAQKNYWANANSEQPLNDGNSPSVTTINCSKEDSQIQGNMGLLQNAVHGPTVLMVKNNKITVPANYSATFVGYKMVNGKQNLVIKLLPSNKQSTSTSQPSPQTSNSLPRFSQITSPGSSNNVNSDNRFTPTFKPPAVQNLTAATEKPPPSQSVTSTLGSLIARKNESVARMGAVNRPSSFETPHKTVQNFNPPLSAVSDMGRKIKEEPKDYNINEHQFFDKDHNHESARDQMLSSPSSRLTVDPTTGFLYRPRHNSDSGTLSSSSTAAYNKDLNSSVLHSSTASGLGSYSYSTFQPKNDFGMRSAQSNDPYPRPQENNKNDNAPFMPRITSVFSLQSQQPDPKPFGKNTYLHNILQDNKRLNDKICIAKTSSPLTNSNTLPFGKQQLPSPVPRFNSRLPNGNVPSAVFLKQEPDSSGSGIRPSFPTRVNELLKTHSDSIVNQQLAKERAVVKPVGQPTFHVYRAPQVSGMPQGNALIYPSGTNRFAVPVLQNQHGLRMVSPQSSTPSTVAFTTSNRLSAPVMLNTKPGMVLTIANGPFGTIRNIANGGSQVMSTVNNFAKVALPRIQRPPVPHIFKSDFGSSLNNVSANIISSSNAGNKLPINLNVLQYCVNSDASGGAAGGIEGNKPPQPMQKQPLYALLPDGKQAVLLNYVLPKTAPAANLQKTVQINQLQRKPIPKRPDEAPQASLLRSGIRPSTVPAASVKEEDTSSFDGYGGNVPANKASNSVSMQSKPGEEKPRLRSNSSTASLEPLPVSDEKTLLQPPATTSRLPKVKGKQNNVNTFNSKSRSCKRKASDSSSYEADFEFRTKKRVTDSVEVPRKPMPHRKCKAKSYTSEVESLPEMPSPPPTPAPSKDVVRTLRLFPLDSNQPVKYPEMDQPVVVLNHPDVDIPEVVSIMRTISKFSGHVFKVSLSKKTIDALLESGLLGSADGPSGRRHRRSKPASPAKDRFVLKLTLKKTSKNNYKIVKNTPTDKHQAKFNCWFCGRIFDNQDEWVGHGQRHLMEATKDWNTLF